MPRGRPTIYSEDLLQRSREYLTEFRSEGDIIPSLAGLARCLKISRETVHDWKKDPEKADFSDICVDILAEQERLLLSNGLTGEFNSTITKLVLSKHGYREASSVEHEVGPNLEDILDNAQ
jgi:hypothetical protein